MPDTILPKPPRRNTSPQANPTPGIAPPKSTGMAALPSHLSRPLTPAAWQTQFDQTQAAGGLGALAAQDAMAEMPAPAPAPAPLGMGGRIAEGFEGLGRGAAAGGLRAVQAIRAPFYSQTDTVGAAPMDDFGSIYNPEPEPVAPPIYGDRVINDPVGQHLAALATEQDAAIAGLQMPASRVAGQGAELVTSLAPNLSLPLGALSGAGTAMLQGKSGAGVALNAGLGMMPGGIGGAASRAVSAGMGRFAKPLVSDTLAQTAIGGSMGALTAAETYALENNDELAAQEAGMILPMAGGMGGLGMVASLLTRGRGAVRPPMASPEPAPVGSSTIAGESPFAAEMADGMFGASRSESPFGGEFPVAPRPDINPEMRASTVSADPVLTGPDGRPALPDVVPGPFVQTGSRQTVGPDGLPAGRPGDFVPAPEARVGVDQRPAELPAARVMDESDGFREMNAEPPTPEGFFRAQPRRPDIQPQRTDPTSLGEAPIRDPLAEYKQRDIDPNAQTRTGSDLSPVEVPDAYELPRPTGSIRGNNTPENDPFGNVDERLAADRRQQAFGDDAAQDPLDAFDPKQIGDFARKDTSLPETELQLDPVAQRAEMATDVVTPVRENVRPEFTSATTQLDLPVTPAKPGMRHLSSEAQDYVLNKLKPGEREMLRESIAHLKKYPDATNGNDKRILENVVLLDTQRRERKPGARPKGVAPEGARPTSTFAEAKLVQGGFRRQGEPTPKPVDVDAPTERITKPAAEPAEVARGAPGTHTLYHGTSRAGFTNFDPYGGEYGLMGDGTYFTDSPAIAREYMSKGKGGSPGTYEAQVTVKNPLDMDAPIDREMWGKALAEDSQLTPGMMGTAEQGYKHQPSSSAIASWRSELAAAKTNEDAFRIVERELGSQQISQLEGREAVTSLIRAMGHDSVTHVGGGRHAASKGTKHRVYIALDPEQVQGARLLPAEAPPKPAPNNARQGAFDPLAPVEAVGKAAVKSVEVSAHAVSSAAQLGGKAAKYLADKWSKRLWTTVRDMPGGKAAGEKARAVLSRAAELKGQFATGRLAALKTVKGVGKKARAARASLEEVEWDGDVGFARIHDVLNGDSKPRPAEKGYEHAVHSLTYRTGLAAERGGMQINVKGKTIPFKADPKRRRAPRVFTGDLQWYASRPGDPGTIALADAIAVHNPGLDPKKILGEMETWSERGITKRGMAEDARVIEVFPSHWRNPEGHIVQLLETDPQVLVDAIAERFPQRIAYAQVFGQGAIPKEFVELERLSGKTAGRKAGEDLFRSLNGMSVGNDFERMLSEGAKPGTGLSSAIRWASFPWETWKSAKLSAAAIVNTFETVGKARAIAGGNPATYLKAIRDVSALNGGRDAIIDDLAQRGVITHSVLDWYINRSDYAETATRLARNVIGAPNHFVNEFNEKISGRMSQIWAEQLQAGKGGGADRIRLAALDYTQKQIDDILDGGFEESLSSDIMRRAVEFAQGSTSQAAEKSRLGNSPLWKKITIADSFSQMNMNRNLTAWSEAAKEILRPKSTFAEQVKAVTAASIFSADLAAGQIAATSLTLLTKAMLTGGLAVTLDKATGSPLGLQDFMIDAAKMAYIGSPVEAVSGALMDSGDSTAESLMAPFLVVSTLSEASNALWGKGRYEGMTGIEAAGKFMLSGVAIKPIVANVMGVVGITQDDPALNAATTAFYKWKKKYVESPDVRNTEDATGFRTAMRKASAAMKAGADPMDAIQDALAIKGAGNVADSLRGKKLLKLLKKDQREAVEEYLGPATMTHLEQYDALLEAWAARVSPRKR